MKHRGIGIVDGVGSVAVRRCRDGTNKRAAQAPARAREHAGGCALCAGLLREAEALEQALARMTVAPPVATSPPAKIPGAVVSRLSRSIRIVLAGVISMPSSGTRKSRLGC